MELGKLMFGDKSDVIAPRVCNTAWGKQVSLEGQKLIKGDRYFIVAQFSNGQKHRTSKTFSKDEASELIEMIASHITTHDFPLRDTRGERQWQRMDSSTFTL